MDSEGAFEDSDLCGAAVTGGLFVDRRDAGQRLARCLRHLLPEDVVVVGLPRGGVPVAMEVARELRAPLDVIVVRKLGRERLRLAGRVVVIVDDGVATGSTARAACQVARAQGAARVVLAVPVAPVGWQERLAGTADELVCVATPSPFFGIGRFYLDFSEPTDEEVSACLARAGERPATAADTAGSDHLDHDPPAARDEEVCVQVGAVPLRGQFTVPPRTTGVVVFAHGSGSSRHSPRNRLVARRLNRAGLATLLFDLLTAAEGGYRVNVFDIDLLAGRLAGATAWLRDQPGFSEVPIGWFGASTGAAAALWAAAEPGADVAAVVSRGGRPDLAANRLSTVRAPTLLIVGGLDPVVLDLNRQALDRLRCQARLAVIPGATHLFEEPGTLEAASDSARAWFLAHLGRDPGRPSRPGRSGPAGEPGEPGGPGAHGTRSGG